jgi:hypothetical protein
MPQNETNNGGTIDGDHIILYNIAIWLRFMGMGYIVAA